MRFLEVVGKRDDNFLINKYAGIYPGKNQIFGKKFMQHVQMLTSTKIWLLKGLRLF